MKKPIPNVVSMPIHRVRLLFISLASLIGLNSAALSLPEQAFQVGDPDTPSDRLP
jgi:hypothetical protein